MNKEQLGEDACLAPLHYSPTTSSLSRRLFAKKRSSFIRASAPASAITAIFSGSQTNRKKQYDIAELWSVIAAGFKGGQAANRGGLREMHDRIELAIKNRRSGTRRDDSSLSLRSVIDHAGRCPLAAHSPIFIGHKSIVLVPDMFSAAWATLPEHPRREIGND
jgi:hypothetical protein